VIVESLCHKGVNGHVASDKSISIYTQLGAGDKSARIQQETGGNYKESYRKTASENRQTEWNHITKVR
jgi:hypothetical protein